MSGRRHRRARHRSGRAPSFQQARPAPNARHIGRCLYTGKYRFPIKRDAKAAKADSGLNSLAVYLCEFCGNYELGSKGGMPRAVHREIHAAKIRQDAANTGVTTPPGGLS